MFIHEVHVYFCYNSLTASSTGSAGRACFYIISVKSWSVDQFHVTELTCCLLADQLNFNGIIIKKKSVLRQVLVEYFNGNGWVMTCHNNTCSVLPCFVRAVE